MGGIEAAWVIAIGVTCLTFASGVLGTLIRGAIPDRIMSPSAQDVLRLINGFIATMAALVFGLVINSANNFANAQKSGLESLSARALQLDRALGEYGPETRPARELLKSGLVQSYEQIWGREHADSTPPKVGQIPSAIPSAISFLETLQPRTESQKRILDRSFDTLASLAEARELMSFQVTGTISLPLGTIPFSTVSWPFVAILVSWVSLVFFGFGMLGRLNFVIATGMAVGAFAIGSALFLILELGQPYTGIARLSPAPLLQAIESMGK